MSNQELDSNMRKSVEAAQRNFNTIRTGRANTSLLDRLTVEYYGAETPLKSLATISTPDSQTISIQPFDLSSLIRGNRKLYKYQDVLAIKSTFLAFCNGSSNWC